MALRRSRLWAVAWHVSLLGAFLHLLTAVVWDDEHVSAVLAGLVQAGFLVGLAWLTWRARTHPPLRDPERYRWFAATAALLVVVGLYLPRGFYQWWRYENDSMMPDWAFGVGMGLARIIVLALLMLFVWLALATLVRRRAAPTAVETGATLAVAIGLSLLLRGAIIYRTDYTSEDILHFTMPYGLAISASGIVLLVLADAWHRLKPGDDVGAES